MIPNTRAVRAADIRTIQHAISLTKTETQLVLGILPLDINRLERGTKKLTTAAALSLRLLDDYGEAVSPLKRPPTFREFRELVESCDPMWKNEPQRFAILFGRHRTATIRWFARQDAVSAMPMVLRRAMQIMWLVLNRTAGADRQRTLASIYDRSIHELVLSGYSEKHLRDHYTFKLATDAVAANSKSATDAKKKKATKKAPTKAAKKVATRKKVAKT